MQRFPTWRRAQVQHVFAWLRGYRGSRTFVVPAGHTTNQASAHESRKADRPFFNSVEPRTPLTGSISNPRALERSISTCSVTRPVHTRNTTGSGRQQTSRSPPNHPQSRVAGESTSRLAGPYASCAWGSEVEYAGVLVFAHESQDRRRGHHR